MYGSYIAYIWLIDGLYIEAIYTDGLYTDGLYIDGLSVPSRHRCYLITESRLGEVIHPQSSLRRWFLLLFLLFFDLALWRFGKAQPWRLWWRLSTENTPLVKAAYVVVAYIVVAYVVITYTCMAIEREPTPCEGRIYSYGLYSCGLCSYGQYTYGHRTRAHSFWRPHM